MNDGKRPPWLQLPSGEITPLGLLGFAGYMFHLSVGRDLETWHRVVLVCIGGLSVLLCLIAFGGKLPCKRRVTTASQGGIDICLRDLGFLSGLVISFLFIALAPPSLWDSVQTGWWQLGVGRFFIIVSLALPTVVHGTIRRVANVQSDGRSSTKLLLFVFGFLNAFVAAALFLEFRT